MYGSFLRHRGIALLSALALAACGDDATDPAGPPVPPASPPPLALGATTAVKVRVPASMRSAPFNVDRYLTVPPGFAAAVYARVGGARFLAVAPNGDLLVSRPGAGKVARVRPSTTGDPTVSDYLVNLRRPHDLVFQTVGGARYLYVAESHQVSRYQYDVTTGAVGARQVVVSGLPDASSPELQGTYGHQLKNIAFDAAGRLYVSIASTCDACLSDTRSDPVRGAIYQYDAGGGGRRLFARGLRNAEGLAVVPGTSTLWVVVNQRDNIPYPFNDGSGNYGRVFAGYVDNHPPEAFTRVRDGGNYGWPFCHPNPNGATGYDDMPLDRAYDLNRDGHVSCSTMDRVSRGIQAHSAPLGLTFLQNTAAPSAYRNGAVVALHGSWNRTTRTGYKVVHFPWNATAQRPGTQTDLVTGWLNGGPWGRPVDVAIDAKGALLVSDDHSGTIYRISYAAPSQTVLLASRASGKCLDVAAASTQAGARTIIWPCHGGANQRWTLPPAGGAGAVRVYGTMCLDDAGGRGADGDPVVIWACHGGANQRWTYTAAGELRGINGKCVDVLGRSTANLTPLVLWTCHGGSNQRWDARRL